MSKRGAKPGERRGGREKGTPNRKTQSLFDLCDELNFNPFKAMLTIAQDDTHKDSALMLKEVCQYLYPKRKSLEHSGSIDPKMQEAAEDIANLNKDEQIAILEQQIKEIKGS